MKKRILMSWGLMILIQVVVFQQIALSEPLPVDKKLEIVKPGPPFEVIGPDTIYPLTLPPSVVEVKTEPSEIPIGRYIEEPFLTGINKTAPTSIDESPSQSIKELSLTTVDESLEANGFNTDVVQPLSMVNNFPGLMDSRYFPPDPTLAAGPYDLVQAVNTKVAISSKTDGSGTSWDLTSWFSNVGTSGLQLFDPWVIYDQYSARFFLLSAAINTSTQQSYLFLSVSTQSDVSQSTWCNYRINSKQFYGSTGLWADYPKVGVNPWGIFITANMFEFNSNNFRWPSLWIFNKSQLNSCASAGSLQKWVFNDLKNPDGTTAFTVQPALTLGNNHSEFMVNALPSGSNKLTFWWVTCNQSPCTSPSIQNQVLFTPTYVSPYPARQPGTTIELDTMDLRLMNAIYYNTYLWTTHTVDSTSSPFYSAVRIYKIDTVYRTTQSQEYSSSGFEYFNPSVSPNLSGGAAVVFNRSSGGEYPSIRYAQYIGGSWQSSVLLHAGNSSSLTSRWGDYAGSSPDPDGSRIWLFNEYMPYDPPYGTWIGVVQ